MGSKSSKSSKISKSNKKDNIIQEDIIGIVVVSLLLYIYELFTKKMVKILLKNLTKFLLVNILINFLL